ncbi:MAG: YdcF family protein [Acetobacteraceae bacterium]|nr:YdcF family protein [Acetobacteraceae bacterium]
MLTGGSGRVSEGLRLLEADASARLLVSGVHQSTALADLVRREGRDAEPLAARVTLGRAARSTRGNAEEAAAWARTQAIDTLVVVTSAYHMPRALLLLRRALPEARLVPHPVTPPALREPRGWLSPAFLRLAAGEYTKWLAALAGVTEDPFVCSAPAETRTAARSAP